jgi:hypothetical protein
LGTKRVARYSEALRPAESARNIFALFHCVNPNGEAISAVRGDFFSNRRRSAGCADTAFLKLRDLLAAATS